MYSKLKLVQCIAYWKLNQCIANWKLVQCIAYWKLVQCIANWKLVQCIIANWKLVQCIANWKWRTRLSAIQSNYKSLYSSIRCIRTDRIVLLLIIWLGINKLQSQSAWKESLKSQVRIWWEWLELRLGNHL